MVNLISNRQSPQNASQVNLNLSPSAVMEYDIEMFGSKHPDFIGTIFVRNPNNPDETLVANARQSQEVQKIFNEYYNYIMPKLQKRKMYKKSAKDMSLRDLEQLTNKQSLAKLDIEGKLSNHLNQLLQKKDDPFLAYKHQVYMRKKLYKALEKPSEKASQPFDMAPKIFINREQENYSSLSMTQSLPPTPTFDQH
jgi:hypothetical protein